MDDDEDFKALFFSEARELLDQLQEHLNKLADDEGDGDTVHAAFRAVHSVKGGAAAFGFDVLIGFAHVFETVMDLVRDGRMALDDELCQTLLRSADMMQILVENADAGDESPVEGMARLQSELESLAGIGGDGEGDGGDAAEAPAAPPPAVPEAEEEEEYEYVFRITPDEAFFESGHDMLRLVRAARERGLVAVHADGELPSLAAFEPARCPLSWELTFRSSAPAEDLARFFDVYSHTAQIDGFGDSEEDGDEEGDEDGAPQGDACAAQDAAGDGEPDDAGEEAVASAAPAGGAGGVAAAPEASPAPEEGGARAAPRAAGNRPEMSHSLRVEISRIDRLVNLVGEMLITQAALAQQLADGQGSDPTDMAHSIESMSRQLRELQESVMAIRAQPVKSVFRRMPRVVRDLSEKLGKQARLDLAGEHTEVDATVIEELAEPLTHMIRNSMDHGLEGNDEREKLGKPRVGRIRLSAEHRGERVTITIEDDGRGVNRERVFAKAVERGLLSPDDQLSPEEIDMLIFHPGFSTAQEVSSVSGRGVGMDVVKKKILSLGGRVSMSSTPGQGTRFVITLPLTLAVMDGMTIAVGDQKYILPLSTVVEALHVTRDASKCLPDGSSLLERRGEYLRLLSLRDALNMPPRECGTEMAIVVDTEAAGLVALTVDELIGQRQIVLKSLEANFHKVDGVSGATILGDGQVALILDVPALMKLHLPGSGLQEILH